VAESYLNFEFAGAGHLAYLDNSASNRWGYLPQRTSRYGMARPITSTAKSSVPTPLGWRDPWRSPSAPGRCSGAPGLCQKTRPAHRRRLRTVPDPRRNLSRAAAEARSAIRAAVRASILFLHRPKTLETRLDQLLTAYPDVDHVWLWRTRGQLGQPQGGHPAATAAFNLAHDFLRRHAPPSASHQWMGGVAPISPVHKTVPRTSSSPA